jgi:hypothetical protein
MAELIAEIFIEFFGELIIDLVASLFADASARGAEKSIVSAQARRIAASDNVELKRTFPRNQPADPMLVACGYIAFGWLVGMLSLWLMPHLFIKDYTLRLIGLFLVPAMSGLVMAWIGSWRAKHNKDVVRIERFSYAFCLAFTISLVRIIWGNAG